MDTESVTALLQAAFPGASVSVELSGGHCNVQVISDEFDGLRSVTRQQLVYAPLADCIASGALHAVNIFAKTPAEVAG